MPHQHHHRRLCSRESFARPWAWAFTRPSLCQGFVLLQGFALPSRSVPRKASSCHQGPAKYTSGQSHAHQSQSLYDRSPHCDDDDGEAAVHIDRAHTRLAACDALYETQAPTTPACKALTCCPARHCPAAPHGSALPPRKAT